MTVRAELSSVSTRLHELVGRVAEIAQSLDGEERETFGPELFEVERTLLTAERRLSRALDR